MKQINKLYALAIAFIIGDFVYAQCPVPSPVTATPSVICSGSSASLNATAAGSSINWYTVPVGGVATGSSASGVDYPVTPVVTTTYYAESFVPAVAGGSVQFNYTGSLQQVIVPAGVSQITITAYGAKGGSVNANSGGLGTKMVGTFNVTQGTLLNIVVGGQGMSHTVTSGGGGASGVASGTTPLIVAGGGGGIDNTNSYTGTNAVITPTGVPGQGIGGVGAVNGADGADFTWVSNGNNISRGGRGFNFNNAGSMGQGGLSPNTTTTSGTWGLGGGGGSVGSGYCNCGGGGGGYSGGGASTTNSDGGGGGSYNSGANQSNQTLLGTGNGTVIIEGMTGGCISASRVPVTVTVNISPTLTIASGNGTVCPGFPINLTASGADTYSWSTGANTASILPSPTITTTYSVTGTTTLAGCSGNSMVTVTVIPGPSLTITGASSICVGQSATLTVGTANTYSWNTGAVTASIVVNPTNTTVYTVIGTSTVTGCSTTSSVSLLVSPCTGVAEMNSPLKGLTIYPNPASGEINIDLNNGKEKVIEITDYTGKVVYSGRTDKDQLKVNMAGFSAGIYQVKVQSENTSETIKVVKQ